MGFFVAALVVPVAVMFIAAAIREYHEAPQTAAAEIPALLLILDGAMIVDAKQFADHIASHVTAADLVWIGLVGFLLSCSLWQFSLNVVEPAILTAHKARRQNAFPLKLWLFAWTSAMLLLVVHMALLAGKVL